MRSVRKHPKKCLGVYLKVYSVFGYVPKQTEWGPRSQRPQTATVVLDRRQSGPLLSKAQSPNIGLSDYTIIRYSDFCEIVYSSRTLLSEAHIGAADNRVYIRARTDIDEYRCTCIFGCVFSLSV